jgi:uncharacterized membrane protein YeaQ/YmgE (transglycosylase-associated protein family)
MDIIWFLLIGLIAGWLAGQIFSGHGYGMVADIVIGILGALIGGSIFNALGVTAYGTLGNIAMAVIGAIVLLFVVRLLSPGHSPRRF